MDEQLNQSPLAECHNAAGARMVPFAGWEMPVQYEGIIPENLAVRTNLGVFDISHMGQLVVGSDEPDLAADWLNGVLTNDVRSLGIGQGQYTFLLNDRGGVIDDLIIYRAAHSEYFLVVNASRVAEDFEWLKSHLPNAGLMLANRSEQFAGLALQGPNTPSAFRSLFGSEQELPERFCMSIIPSRDGDVIVCRTGYTGEDGVELFCPSGVGPTWWQKCLGAGAVPCGLGARDSLRLEKCYPLNGNDLSKDRTPLEAGMGFAVDLHKASFPGREALLRQRTKGLQERLAAIRQTAKSPPPRPGYKVYVGEEQIGSLCSGGMSPNLKCGIGLAYLNAAFCTSGTAVELEIRGKRYPAEIVKKPFV